MMKSNYLFLLLLHIPIYAHAYEQPQIPLALIDQAHIIHEQRMAQRHRTRQKIGWMLVNASYVAVAGITITRGYNLLFGESTPAPSETKNTAQSGFINNAVTSIKSYFSSGNWAGDAAGFILTSVVSAAAPQYHVWAYTDPTIYWYITYYAPEFRRWDYLIPDVRYLASYTLEDCEQDYVCMRSYHLFEQLIYSSAHLIGYVHAVAGYYEKYSPDLAQRCLQIAEHMRITTSECITAWNELFVRHEFHQLHDAVKLYHQQLVRDVHACYTIECTNPL